MEFLIFRAHIGLCEPILNINISKFDIFEKMFFSHIHFREHYKPHNFKGSGNVTKKEGSAETPHPLDGNVTLFSYFLFDGP